MAGLVPKRTLEDIRFRTDIADLVGSYINLKKAGTALKALCPFHKEKTPSFTVNPQRQIFHCFGCGEGGDVFGFLMKYEGVDFMTAVRMLADRCGVTIETEEGDRQSADKVTFFKIHEELAQFYRRCLLQMPAAQHARDYLESRQLDTEIGEAFGIGYAPNRWDAVSTWGAKYKYTQEQLETCGLLVKTEKDSGRVHRYDRFRDRLMFPIRDEQKRIIGFSGRALVKDDRMAKYVNSPETPLFKKSRVLYALEKARRNIVDCREAILCEGQIDVIRCHQAGFTTAVASQGTAFTPDHARILKRYADMITLVFDPDKAGQDATVKAAVIFMQSGLSVRAARLPDGEDPDSFISAHGAEAFREILGAATSAIAFQIAFLSDREDASSEVGRMRIARAVLETISHSPNAVQRSVLIQEAAERLRLPAASLQQELQHLQDRNRRYERRHEEVPTPDEQTVVDLDGVSGTSAAVPEAPITFEERALCEHLADGDPQMAATVRGHLPLSMIKNALCRRMVRTCLEAIEKGEPVHEAMHAVDDEGDGFKQLAAAVQMAPNKTPGSEFSAMEAVRDLILQIWRRHMKARRAELQQTSPKLASQISHDLKTAFLKWDTASALIELEIEQGEWGESRSRTESFAEMQTRGCSDSL